MSILTLWPPQDVLYVLTIKECWPPQDVPYVLAIKVFLGNFPKISRMRQAYQTLSGPKGMMALTLSLKNETKRNLFDT